MKIILHSDAFSSIQPEMIVEDKGLRLIWNVSNFAKKEFTNNDNDVCKHINQYWATLDDETQSNIFTIFAEIRRQMDIINDSTLLTQTILPLVKSLYEYHPLEKIEHWIIYNSDIILPSSQNNFFNQKFLPGYEENDQKPGNRIKTYTRPDYIGLVALTLSLRPMIPIWGEFIYRTKGDTGTKFKEFFSFRLLAGSSLIKSYPMEKLESYVTNNIKNTQNFSAILNGVGSEDYPVWLLSLVVVRRLCIGNISGVNPDINLVTFVFNFINQKLNNSNNDTTFGQTVRPKDFPQDNGESDNVSRAEVYKIKQEIPNGDIAIIEHFMKDPYHVAKLLDPEFDKDLLDMSLETTKALNNSPLSRHQIILCQWVMSRVVNPRGFVYLTKQKVINAIAITEAWLWKRKHFHLSCLVSAVVSDNRDDLMISGLDSRARISRDQMEILTKLYPYTVNRSQRTKVKPPNDAVVAIDTVTDLISQHDWILTAHPEHTKIVTNSVNYNRYSAPHEIKMLLANLVIDLEKDTLQIIQSSK